MPAAEGRAIRPAIPADEPAIRVCAERAYARYVPVIGRRPAPMDADVAARIAAGEVHVATDDAGALRGFVVFRPYADHMLLENVAVLPEEAGRGTGSALIRFCEDTARSRGLATVRLYTNARMTENLALYPRLGYTETARRTEDGFDRVFFEKALALRRP
jgi:ribosomal protein S18 acetylase RimI-like enzyme